MHTTYLELVPTDPTYVPTAERMNRARAVFETLMPGVCGFSLDEYGFEMRHSDVYPTIQLFSGIFSDKAFCPKCNSDLSDWWMPELSRKSELRVLSDLQIVVPCCNAITYLHELFYPFDNLTNVYTVGFGRFCLSADTVFFASGISQDAWLPIEKVIGCKLKTLLVSF